MANTSIVNAFERMWQHLVSLLGGKVDKVSGKGLSTNDFTDAYKSKLDNFNGDISNITVDSALSSSSTNPVQNKVVKAELDKKVDKVSGKGLSTNDFTNAYKNKVDSALQSFTETDPTVPAWAKAATKPNYTAAEVGAETSGAVSTHNTSVAAHNDIRILITDLTTKLNNFLDVDDATTDQLSEVLTLINNNKGTLESLTSGKVNVTDIIDNLTTNSASKALSAAQGVAIKALIDALQIEVDGKVPASRTVNGKSLDANITLSASDVGAATIADIEAYVSESILGGKW